MNSFQFASPYWLILLVPLFILAILDSTFTRRNKATVLFSTTIGLDEIPASLASRFKRFLPCLVYCGAAFVVVALARPQYGIQRSRIVGDGVSIVMCVDRSGSMAAEEEHKTLLNYPAFTHYIIQIDDKTAWSEIAPNYTIVEEVYLNTGIYEIKREYKEGDE